MTAADLAPVRAALRGADWETAAQLLAEHERSAELAREALEPRAQVEYGRGHFELQLHTRPTGSRALVDRGSRTGSSVSAAGTGGGRGTVTAAGERCPGQPAWFVSSIS